MRPGKRTAAVLAALLLAAAGAAEAVEISAGSIVPFGENSITVYSDETGTLTLTPGMSGLPLMPAAEDMPVEAGENTLVWDGLSWNGEPLPQGKITLAANVTDEDGNVSGAEIKVRVEKPLCAAVYCLPAADRFCPSSGESLKVECGLSKKGTVILEIAAADEPDKVIQTIKEKTDGALPAQCKWDGKNKSKKWVKPGRYLLTAYSKAVPEIKQTAEVTVTEEPDEVPDIFVTGDLLPGDPDNDQEVWEALIAPVVVGDGTEGSGLYIHKKKTYSPAGSISCRTAGVKVLEIYDDGWCRVGAWRQAIGEYIEGYIHRSKLTVVVPRSKYGAVIDKKEQTLTVYEDGKRIGKISVSTGLLNSENLLAATPAGVYLTGSRLKDFQNSGYHYDYPIRLHGDYLLHTVGYKTKDSERSYLKELEELGRPASHGCVRMDIRAAEESGGLNAWWIWTHFGRDTKVIVLDDQE